MSCGIGGDRIELVLWHALNLPFFLNLGNVVVLCGANNVQQDSSEDILDGN